MSGTSTPVNPLELSDEDFLKLGTPPAAPAAGEGGEGDQGSEGGNGGEGEGDDSNTGGEGQGGDEGSGDGAGGTNDDDPDGAGADEGDGTGEGESEGGGKSKGAKDKKPDPTGDKGGEGGNLPTKDKSQEQDPAGKKPAEAKNPDDKSGKSGEGDGSQTGSDPSGSKAGDQKATPPDYKAFYEKIMAPLKANGKTIELRNPEEAIQLMQMGANYTRKMQALAPHRKMLLMLENNGLLDEGKLSYLIDLDKKNPEAIKKLIKDAGLDPQEIDLDDPKAKPYLEGNHRVSDEEAGFRAVLDELSSNPEGKTTLQVIQTQWDQASKEVLWKQPDVMTLIHQQRENGIYDRIATELERQRSLGQIPPNVPFLHAYKAIGDQLAAAGGFDDLVKPAPVQQQPAQPAAAPVATTVAKPKPAVANGDKVSAASPTRSTPRKAETTVNPLALSDDEFMKQVEQFQGRL